MDALSAVIESEGPERAHFLLEQLLEHARQTASTCRFRPTPVTSTPLNPTRRSVAPVTSRSKGACVPTCAGTPWPWWSRPTGTIREDGGDLGGHIGSFASLAHMFGAGFNHFWHAESENHGGDCLYIQGHVAPGVYARAYLEGRLTEEQLLNFRQEVVARACRATRTPS
jgi:pyruvate dehydrogenase E1 component